MHFTIIASLIILNMITIINAQYQSMGNAPVNVLSQHHGTQSGSVYEFEVMPTRIMDQANMSSGEHPVKLDSFY